MRQRKPGNIIAGRQWNKNTFFYVEHVRGEDNPKSDWGYTTNRARALPLNSYWARRFAADCRRVGAVAQLVVLPRI